MSKDESRRGARGWLAEDHTYRRQIVDEIQKRADYPIRQRARVTRIMMAGPTSTDYFRAAILDLVKDSVPNEETEVRNALRDLIISMSPDADLSPLDYEFKILAKAISEVTSSIPPVQTQFRETCRDRFEVLVRAFDRGQPFHSQKRPSETGRDREFDEMPFQNGGARGKFWLDFSSGLKVEGHRLRLHRESYPSNESINLWEDFGSGDIADRNAFMLEDNLGARLNPQRTGIDAFEDLMDAHPESIGQYHWSGKLLSTTHFWVLPAIEALSDLEPEVIDAAKTKLRRNPDSTDEEVRALLKSAAKFASRSFEHRDPTSGGDTRSDHVLTLVGDGDVILIADFQAFSRHAAPTERAVRYALLNLGASEDKLGRILMRLNDIEAYRIVALRDYQFTFPVTNVIDACNAHIAFAENEAAQKNIEATTYRERRESMDKLLSNITDLSTRITAANHFIEGGLVGLADRATEMQGLIHTRLSDLNERSVLGYQSLSGYIRKVDNAVNSMQRSKSRYIRARERINEIVNIARGDIEKINSSENNSLSKVILGFTFLVVSIEVFSASIDVFDLNFGNPLVGVFGYVSLAGFSFAVGWGARMAVKTWLRRQL